MKKTGVLKLTVLVLLLSLSAIGLFWATANMDLQSIYNGGGSSESAQVLVASSGVPDSEPEPQPEPEPSKLHFMAAGDNLIHDNIYKQAAARVGGNGFDFDLPYEHVAGLFEDADIAFINQETIIAENIYPLSGYPLFNSPEAVGDKIVDMGFNVVCMSNNHMFDMGEPGLIAAMDFWGAKPDVLSMGAWRTEEDMQQPVTIEKNGITIGFVPITEHTNGLKLPAKTPLRFIRSDEYDLMKQQVELARANSDFVVVSIHWGTENSNNTNDNQLELSQMFADWGVDLVLGHHSHTLQPMEWRTGQGGNRMLVVYSLGNFISSMLDPQNMLGGVLDLDIEKDPKTGETTITRAKMNPIVTQYDTTGRKDVRIYPFIEYTDELVKKHGMTQWHGQFSQTYLSGIIKKNIPTEFLNDDVLTKIG
ncbi:CapA family protein [Oscillospiraceae bacterium LTW-04]|nr:CapA family protein [Oscillospiraceae bacterium MB24-C1]